MVPHALRKLAANAEAFAVALLVVAAVAPFGRLFADHRALALGAGAAFAATVLVLIIAPRLPLPASVAVAVVAGFAYMAAFVFHTAAPAAVWNGTTGAWSSLLTATLPAVSSATFIAFPIALAWVAAYVGAELVVRTRWAVGPVIPPCAALVVALLFTGKRPPSSMWLTLALIVLVLAIVLVRANLRVAGAATAVSDVKPSRVRAGSALGLGVAGVAAASALAVGGAAVLPLASTSRRVDLHERYRPPVKASDSITPLAELQQQLLSTTTTPLFTVRFSGIPATMQVTRLRIATLDAYDGAAWTSDASFALAGKQLPAGPVTSLPTALVHEDIQLNSGPNGYQSPYLPSLDRPVQAVGKNVGFDRVSGMLAWNPTGRALHYRVVSQVADERGAATKTAKPGADPAFAPLVLPPAGGWPTEIVNFASGIGSPNGPFATLQTMADRLRSSEFGYNVRTRPGHSLGVLSQFLTPPSATNDVTTARIGYAEQFASAFAVLARIKGFPSRVAVGYKIDPAAAASGKPVAVLAQQAHAWAEVNLNGVGWVTFDPTNPTPRTAVTPPAPKQKPAPAPVPFTQNNGKPVPRRGPLGTIVHHVSGWVLVAALFLILLIGLPAAVFGLKTLRRRRRATRGSPATRVVGAWREARDNLRSVGAPVASSMTIGEASGLCRDRVGDDVAVRVAEFGPLVANALYAPVEPSEETVEAAWRAEESLRALLGERSSAPRRVLAAVDPRSLVRIGSGSGG